VKITADIEAARDKREEEKKRLGSALQEAKKAAGAAVKKVEAKKKALENTEKSGQLIYKKGKRFLFCDKFLKPGKGRTEYLKWNNNAGRVMEHKKAISSAPILPKTVLSEPFAGVPARCQEEAGYIIFACFCCFCCC
jgi:hypothetical protein